MNQSGLEPTGVAVLLESYTPERKTGLIEIPDIVQGRQAMIDNRAIVVAVGPSAWHDEPFPRADVGDKVLVTQFAGYIAIGPKDGKRYRLVNDRDIFCKITHEETESV